ncbi:MAG: Gfo/Idh/MocA family oxidoreductase [Solobacterium sp.]|nr:Gfo/Idh/MocA family oxidoreductase [Solobacterium sp.]
MEDKIIKYGILSTASIVPRFVKGMRLTPNGEVTAIASRTKEKAEQAGKYLQIPLVFDDYHALLEHPDIDAVYVPVINSLHYQYAKDALLAGKHVIVEKPFVLHAYEAAELFALAQERSLFITEAIKTPFLPLYQKVKERIDSGEFGAIRFMTFRQSYTGGSYIAGWNRQKEFGGGVLYGNEAYFFRMAEYFGGKILSCTGTASFPGNEAEDQCSLSVSLENGSLASLAVSTRVLFENGLTIYLDKAVIEIPDYWKASRAVIRPQNKEEQIIRCPSEYELQYELKHYNTCILEGRNCSPVNTPDMTIRYIRICELLYQSFENGGQV